MNFFLTLTKNSSVGFSPFPEKENLDSSIISYLSVPLPLGLIQVVQEQLDRQDSTCFWRLGSKQKDIKFQILKILRAFDCDLLSFTWKETGSASSIRQLGSEENQEDDQEDEVRKDFNQLVLGRQLSIGDLYGLARELRVKEEEIIKLAHFNVEKGRGQWIPAVKSLGNGWQCQRCGEKDVEEWPSLYGKAATCRSCESIGSSTSLDVLYRDQRALLDSPSEVLFQPHWVLTEAQRLASEQVLEFLQDPSVERALLWAACGAGKTEVCFPSAALALKQGKSVLFAAPRQDVINDIVPRLKRDFPAYPFQVLTGTSLVKYKVGGMVLATTHQVLRFWRAFDVIFMDEMDAFPYHGSRALEWGLKHALCQDGKMLYLSATPSPQGLKAAHQGKMKLIRLPARHHRNPLPVPSWERSCYSFEPKASAELETTEIETLRVQGPVLLFVPKISWIAPSIKCFQRRFPHWCIDGSYSADQGRFAKIERLRQGEFDLFVSTTILERGITLPGIQVVVLAADHPVFDERALVQMAGRVGRTRENPGGRVVFMAKHRTSAMRTAVQWIEDQNRLALELGLIEV